MGGIMRAPSPTSRFEIPYSGTHAYGDCILVINPEEKPIAYAYYDGIEWVYDPSFVAHFSDENNVITINTMSAGPDSHAAFIPGPGHV